MRSRPQDKGDANADAEYLNVEALSDQTGSKKPNHPQILKLMLALMVLVVLMLLVTIVTLVLQILVFGKEPNQEPNPFEGYGQMVFRNEKYSQVNSLAVLKNPGKHVAGLQYAAEFSNLLIPLKGAWIEKDFIEQWNQRLGGGDNTKVRFVFWERKGDNTLRPVVDYIFNGEGTNFHGWFTKSLIVEMNAGPNIKQGYASNYWSSNGDTSKSLIMRNFFINKNYGGCENDAGFIVVSDGIDYCRTVWMGGKGWNSFPRFLYASNPNGCKWADTGCAKEADIFTISVL